MKDRKIRILMAKMGDGFETAMMKLASAFSEAGFEVIYTDLQEPEAIVSAALQESVDHIGITTLPGADINRFSKIFELLKKENVEDIKVTAGGFLDEADIPKIKEMGVVEFFPKGTTYAELIQWAKENIKHID
ncbi:MAG TPA: methylmalonyl-CoA mutase [Deltaproteobacteria bacterium]|nr:MAG: methylmalonyl-CoA mutase [Deltaproteobacteria bacterium]RLB07946.1 MAG: methylmalonyl-CoA mutase [Deltaproteobacteria bacterium]HDM76883.1 methylmalonyl-CoA mutase [Deltaproteobacteria bacterium]HEC31172.1 methylmalonyl-CoA mutase [Deltaproteobacteria bacterium]